MNYSPISVCIFINLGAIPFCGLFESPIGLFFIVEKVVGKYGNVTMELNLWIGHLKLIDKYLPCLIAVVLHH